MVVTCLLGKGERGIIRKEFEWQQLVCNKVVHLTDVSEKNVP
jgi:hypothetical protein